MKKVRQQFRNSVTVKEARLASYMTHSKTAVKFTEEYQEARKKGKGRNYRGQSADHMTDVNSRFAGIYGRSSYQARRGR